jgi:diguanylate cyclase (GGDEF)-like protein
VPPERLGHRHDRAALRARVDLALTQPHDYGPVLFYVDLNGFKKINDRYGHAAGDHVLTEFAHRLTAAIRQDDVAARLGGDEFVVLATDLADDAAALETAGRLRDLATSPVRRGDETYPIGVSVGLAVAGELPHPDTDSLLAAADTRMYAEKASAVAVPLPLP